MLATETQYPDPGSTRQQFSDFESHEVRGPSPGWAGRRCWCWVELHLSPVLLPPHNISPLNINITRHTGQHGAR